MTAKLEDEAGTSAVLDPEKELGIRNTIAHCALEGLHATPVEIARVRALAYGEITLDKALVEIGKEVAELLALEKEMIQKRTEHLL